MSEKRRPFYEVIVEILNRVSDGYAPHTMHELFVWLLTKTEIPQNHDAIIAVWRRYADRHHVCGDCGVSADILVQKHEVEERARLEAEEIMR